MDYGIYSAILTTSGDWKAGIPVKIDSAQELKLKEVTTLIPCRAGVYWGLRGRIANPGKDKSATFTYTITHPPFTNPKGETSTREVQTMTLKPQEESNIQGLWFFIDSCPFELVPGQWTLAISCNGQTLATRTFEVYQPK